MPFGFRSAKDEFQRKIDEIIEGLQGIGTLVADILVYGKTHYGNLCDLAKKGSRLTLKTHCWCYRSSIVRTYTVRKRSLAGFRQIAEQSTFATSKSLREFSE